MKDNVPIPRRFLLTGIPGTGKTAMGQYLGEHHDFLHVDVEDLISSGPMTHGQLLETIRNDCQGNRDVVVTWGFMPGSDDNAVRAIQVMGFRMIWFDGDREAARKAFLHRGTVEESLFDLQIARIEGLDLDSFRSVSVFNPFAADGSFLPKAQIADRLLSLA